jgi:WhiB family redox-sensing transcriptional regulator
VFQCPAWMRRALCRQVDPETFFPHASSETACREAKSVCAACPVQPECLDWALTNREEFGIFGGKTERERRRILRRRAAA